MRQGGRRLLALVAVVAAAGGGNALWQQRAERRVAEAVASRAAPGDIEMYSSVSCAYCRLARDWFTTHKVPFAECLIERDNDCRQRFEALLSPGTPTLKVRGQRQVGFDPRRIAEALGEEPIRGQADGLKVGTH